MARKVAVLVALGASLWAAPARADRIALVPSRGGLDPSDRTRVDGELTQGFVSLGHSIVPAQEVLAAITAQVPDGVVDTQVEFRAVGGATHADWVIVASIEPAVTTVRVELSAFLVQLGRLESVAREVERAREPGSIVEMLQVLVRPEGIGIGALPWEGAPPAPPPPPASPPPTPNTASPPPAPSGVPPVEGRAHLVYPIGPARDAWPPYSGGRRGFASISLGGSGAVQVPSSPTASSTSNGASLSVVRGGYAVTDLGLEPFAEFGGNLSGPRALWLALGARWMFPVFLRRDATGVLSGIPLFVGPEVSFGAFFNLGGTSATLPNGRSFTAPTTTDGLLGASIDVSYALSEWLSLEAGLGNLRWISHAGGSLVLMGVTTGATLRF